MKRLLLLVVLLMVAVPLGAAADEIHFSWTKNPTVDNVVNYILLEKMAGGLFNPAEPAAIFPAEDGAGEQVGYYYPMHLIRGETYVWVLMAEDADGMQSDYSNPVSMVYDWDDPIITVVLTIPQNFGVRLKLIGPQ